MGFVSATSGGTWDGSAIEWLIPRVDPGQTITLTYVMTMPPGLDPVAQTAINNAVHVDATSLPGAVAGERTFTADTDETVTVGLPQPVITKSGDRDVAPVDAKVNVKVDVTIPAGGPYYDALIWDQIPDGVSFRDGSLAILCESGCPAGDPAIVALDPFFSPGGFTRIGAFLGDLPVSASDRVYSFVYGINIAQTDAEGNEPSLGEIFTNTATVSYNAVDRSGSITPNLSVPPAGDAEALATDDLEFNRPVLSIDKVANVISPVDLSPTAPVTYTITVCNSGGVDASSVEVSDTFHPSGNTGYISSIVSSTGSVSLLRSSSAAKMLIDTVSAGSCVEIVYEIAFDGNLGSHTSVNDAAVTSFTDPWSNPYDASEIAPTSAEFEILSPMLDVQKDAVKAVVSTEDKNIAWDVTITNNGTGTAYNVTLADTVPEGQSSASISDPNWSTYGGNMFGYVNPIPPGGTVTVRVTTSGTLPPGPATNNAHINWTDGAGNGGSTFNGQYVEWVDADDATVTVHAPSLSIVKTPDLDDDPTPYIVQGTNGTFLIRVTNDGMVPLANVAVSDELPDTLTYAAGSASMLFLPPAGYSGPAPALTEDSAAAPNLAWTIDQIPVGGVVQITLPVGQDGSRPAEAELMNTAYAKANGVAQESDEGALVFLANIKSPVVSKTASPAFGAPGDVVTWTVTAVRPQNAVDVYDVTVIDTIPDGFKNPSLQSVSCSGGCTPPASSVVKLGETSLVDGRSLVGWHIGDVPADTPEATYTFTFTSTVAISFNDGLAVVDGVHDPLVNAVRAYYNLATDNATPAVGTQAPSNPTASFELKGRVATAAFDIRTPHINVNKTIEGRTPFTWTEPVAPNDSFTTYAANPGETLTWLLEITNDGSSPAVDLTIDDDLAAGELSNVSFDLPAGVTSTLTATGVRFTFAAPLAAGDSITVKYTGTIPSSPDLAPDYTINPRDVDKVVNSFTGRYHTLGDGVPDDLPFTDVTGDSAEVDIYTPTLKTRIGGCIDLAAGAVGQVTAQWWNHDWQTSWGNVLWTGFPDVQTPDFGVAVDPVWTITLPAGLGFVPGSVVGAGDQAGSTSFIAFRDPDSITTNAGGSTTLLWNLADQPYNRDGAPALNIKFSVTATSGPFKGGVSTLITSDDVTGADRRGDAVNAEHVYRDAWASGCAGGNEFYKTVENKMYTIGMELEGKFPGDAVTWRVSEYSTADLTNTVLTDVLPLGVSFVPNVAVFTVDGLGVAPGASNYPTETVTVLPSGQQQIVWQGGALAGPYKSLQGTIQATVDATALVGATLVNVAQLDADQPLASNTMPPLPAGFSCAETADCEIAAVLVRDSNVPTISKDAIAGTTGAYGTTADFRVRVTIPAGHSYEDLHVVDALGGGLPGTSANQSVAAADSVVLLTSSCVSGCGNPADALTLTQLGAINNASSQEATAWTFGDVTSAGTQRVFEFTYRITTLDLLDACAPLDTFERCTRGDTTWTDTVALREFTSPSSGYLAGSNSYWKDYGSGSITTDGTASASITRSVPWLASTKTCVSRQDGTTLIVPTLAGPNVRCTIAVKNIGTADGYGVKIVDTPNPIATGSGVADFPITWQAQLLSGSAPDVTIPTNPWDGTSIGWDVDPDVAIAPGETWTFVVDWRVTWDPTVFSAAPSAFAYLYNSATLGTWTDDPADPDQIGTPTTVSGSVVVRPPSIKVSKQHAYPDPAAWPISSEGYFNPTQASVWNGEGFSSSSICEGKLCMPGFRDIVPTVYAPGGTVPTRIDLYLTGHQELSTINLNDVLPQGWTFRPGSARLVHATPLWKGFATTGTGAPVGAISPVEVPIGDPVITPGPQSCGDWGSGHGGGDTLTWPFMKGASDWHGLPWIADGQLAPGIFLDNGKIPAATAHVVLLFDMMEDGAFDCTAPPRTLDTFTNEADSTALTVTGAPLIAPPNAAKEQVLNHLVLDKTPDGGMVVDDSTGWFEVSVENWAPGQYLSPKVPDEPFARDETYLAANNVVLTDTIIDDGLYAPGTAIAVFEYPDGSSAPAPLVENSVVAGTDAASGRTTSTITWTVPTLPAGRWYRSDYCQKMGPESTDEDGTPCALPTRVVIKMPIYVPLDTPDGTLYPNTVEASNDLSDDEFSSKEWTPLPTATWTAQEVGDITVRNPSPPPVPTKTATPQVAPGGIIDWKVSLILEKNRVWWDLSYTDTLPSLVDFLGYGAVSCKYVDNGAPCSIVPQPLTKVGNQIGWYIGDIPTASSRDRMITVAFRGRVTDPSWDTADTVTNTVVGYSFEEDVPTPPTAPVTAAPMISEPGIAVTEIVEPNLVVDKSVAAGPFGPGDSISWTVTVTNTGDGTAYSAMVVDHPSPVVENIVPTGTNAAMAVKGWTAADPSMKWFIPSLAAGESITFDYSGSVKTDYADGGYVTADNVVDVGPYSSQPPHVTTGRTYDPVSDDASAPLVAPKLVAEKFTSGDCTATGATVSAGEHVTFCVRVTNVGTQTASGVDLLDILPRGWSYVAGSASPTAVVGTTAWGSTSLSFAVGDIGMGDSATVTYQAFASVPGAASAADNVVSATADLPDGSPGTGIPGYAATADAPLALKDSGLEISKTPDQQVRNWAVNEDAEWDLTVTNPQAGDLTGVTVTDTFPADWTFVSSTPAPSSVSTDSAGRAFVTWEIGPLLAGANAVVHVVASPPVQPSPIATSGDAGRYDRNYATADADQISGTVEDDGYVKLYTPITVGDLLWEDLDGDGLQDSGEPGIGGVTVTLLGVDVFGKPVSVSVPTNPDGTYSFTTDQDGVALAPGTYTVTFGLPSGYSFTTQGAGADVTAGNDSNVNSSGSTPELVIYTSTTTIDAGVVRPVTIGDFVWEDSDGDGVQDSGEPGVGGVTVELLDADGNVIATTTTDADGHYLFTEDSNGDPLMPGSYAVQFTAPDGFMWTSSNAGSNDGVDSDADSSGTTGYLSVASGGSNLTFDGGLVRPVTIGDFVWEDSDGDGVQDSGEPGVGGVTVELLDADGNVIATTTTDADGHYLFTEDSNGDPLMPGSYAVQFTAPDGFMWTSSNAGSNDGADSDADSSGLTGHLSVASGGSNLTFDGGLVRPGSIGDYVWNDADGDGIQDAGELPVEGVTVNLLDADGNVIATTTTDADGHYLFTGLMPGSYFVQFIAPEGYAFTLPGQGSDSSMDSDGELVPVTLGSGENRTDIDAGLVTGAVDLVKTVAQEADADGIVTWHIKVTNVGPSDLVDVAVTDREAPACDRSIELLAPDEMLEWDCKGPIPDDGVNEAFVTAVLSGTETRVDGVVTYSDAAAAAVAVAAPATPSTTTTGVPSTTVPAATAAATPPRALATTSTPSVKTGANLVFGGLGLVLFGSGAFFLLVGRRSRRKKAN